MSTATSGDGPTGTDRCHSPIGDFFQEERKRLHCPLYGCRRVYTDTDALNNHVKDHQIFTQSLPGKTFLCSALDCNSSFVSMQALMEHTRHHYKPNIYFLCESCRSKLRSYPALLKHINNCSKVAKGKAGKTAEHGDTDMNPDANLDHNPNPTSAFDPTTPAVMTGSSSMDQDSPRQQADPALPPFLSQPHPPENRPLLNSSGTFSHPDAQMQAQSHPFPQDQPLPQDHTQAEPQAQQDLSAPACSSQTPPGSNAVWKKNQGSSFNSRILWEHTRGRYRCIQCGTFRANRPEMTAHIESQHKSPVSSQSKQASGSTSCSSTSCSSTPQLRSDSSSAPERRSKSSTRLRTSSSATWTESFKVPWEKMPDDLQAAIANKTRPSLGDRRVMVRVVVDAMREYDMNPTRPKCAAVAAIIVRQYPESFADAQEDGTFIGTGYDSLLTQLKIRVEHLNRGKTSRRIRKVRRPVKVAVQQPSRGPADQYGCVRWQPESPPAGETKKTLEGKRLKLVQIYSEKAGEVGAQVDKLMEITYCLQREALNAVPPRDMSDLKLSWPYLFSPKCFYAHFRLLTDAPVLERMKDALALKGEKILKFFEQNKDSEVRKVLSKYTKGKDNSMTTCIVLLLMAHFKEKSDGLFLQADESATADDVERAIDLPAMPRLILQGKTLMTSHNWMLSIEGQVVVGPHPDVVAGLAALFASYYVFNMKYEDEAACTLEFIQRSLVGINPATGSKTRPGEVFSKKSGRVVQKKRTAMNARVCTLLLSLMDFEWPPV